MRSDVILYSTMDLVMGNNTDVHKDCDKITYA